MEGTTEFFSEKHKRLLTIAAWTKYLAWAALILIIVNSGLGIGLNILKVYQYQAQEGFLQTWNWNDFQAFLNILDPFFWVDAFFGFAVGILRAVIYYMVLKGVSLGLSMIVETDINYREKRMEEEKQ